MVLNDIGPFVSGESRAANAALASMAAEYETEKAAVDFVLETKKAFGPFSKNAAEKFARDSLVKGIDGKWRLHYDPEIIYGRKSVDTNLWHLWDRIKIPVFTVWGEESTLLSSVTVAKMKKTGPKSKLLAIKGVGHCPGLTSKLEIDAIEGFLKTK